MPMRCEYGDHVRRSVAGYSSEFWRVIPSSNGYEAHKPACAVCGRSYGHPLRSTPGATPLVPGTCSARCSELERRETQERRVAA
jgi:hypothetical protein